MSIEKPEVLVINSELPADQLLNQLNQNSASVWFRYISNLQLKEKTMDVIILTRFHTCRKKSEQYILKKERNIVIDF